MSVSNPNLTIIIMLVLKFLLDKQSFDGSVTNVNVSFLYGT